MSMMKIVVRAPNWIGDTILAFPAIESLRANFPQAQIWLAAKPWIKDFFVNDDLVQGILALSDSNSLKGMRQEAQKLKDFSFDLGLLLPNSFSSAFLFYLARIPQRWGYATDGRALLLTKGLQPANQDSPAHQVDYYLRLLAGLGLKTVPPEIKLTLSPAEKEDSRRILRSLDLDFKKPLILLNPGAYYGPAKRWPGPQFARLAALFQEKKDAEIALIGSADEVGIAESVSALMDKKPAILSGKTNLRQLAAIISQAALFVTNDTGPMHLANALRIPVIAIFGPTNPAVTGPFHPPSAVIQKEVSCWPCEYRKCPYDHRCMMTILPEEVFSVAQKFLE